MLREVDYKIIEEYFINGFNKRQAYLKYYNKHKTKNSEYASTSSFWAREEVKEFIKQRQEEALGDREQLINEILTQLKSAYFEKPLNAEEGYLYREKQRDLELFIKVSGFDKKPKYAEAEAQDTTITVNLIED